MNFAVVGLRLLAIYFWVEAVPMFASVRLMMASLDQIAANSQNTAYITALVPSVLLMFLGILLFIFSVPLARRLAPPISDEATKTACTLEELQAITFAAVGVLILAMALPHAGSAVQNLISLFSSGQGSRVIAPQRLSESWMYSAGIIAQIIIGLVLLLNPKGFRNIWRWLRTAGT